MDNRKKQIISEYSLLSKAPQDAVCKTFTNKDCSIYYQKLNDLYTLLKKRFSIVLGIKDMNNDEELMTHLNNLVIDTKKDIAIKSIEQDPLFIKLMGENAISQKSDLERAICIQLNPGYLVHGYDRNPEEFINLCYESKKYRSKLDKCFIDDIISEEKYLDFVNQLNYCFDYLMSISKGEQKEYRKMTDYEIKSIENNTNKHI